MIDIKKNNPFTFEVSNPIVPCRPSFASYMFSVAFYSTATCDLNIGNIGLYSFLAKLNSCTESQCCEYIFVHCSFWHRSISLVSFVLRGLGRFIKGIHLKLGGKRNVEKLKVLGIYMGVS